MKVTYSTLFKADALYLLERLDEGQFTLAYIDPPWATSNLSETKYQEYRHFISHIVQQCWRLLSNCGTLYFHAPSNSHTDYRLILNQVFSRPPSSVIVWRYRHPKVATKIGIASNNHEEILRYTKISMAVYNPILLPPETHSFNLTDERGPYRLADLTTAALRPSLQYNWRDTAPPAGRSWRFSQDQMEQYFADDRIAVCDGGKPRIKQYFDEKLGKEVGSVWDDISHVLPRNSACPSAKPPELCSRIIRQATNEGDWVLDPFCGSGQLLVQAQQLDRNWIGCDSASSAIETTQALFAQKVGSSSSISLLDEDSLCDLPRISTIYQDIFLTNENLESARRKLSKLAEFTSILKRELAENQQDDDEIILALQQMIPRLKWLVSDEPVQRYKTEILQRIPEFSLLEENSQEFIITAKVILETLSEPHDYAVVSISAWKAVELELNIKLLLPFRDWVIRHHFDLETFIAADLAPPDINSNKDKSYWIRTKLAEFIKNGRQIPALGQINNILTKCATSKKTIEKSHSLKTLKDFIQEQYHAPDFLLADKGIRFMLKQDNIKLYRNGAAHTSLFPKALAAESLEFVMKCLESFGSGFRRK